MASKRETIAIHILEEVQKIPITDLLENKWGWGPDNEIFVSTENLPGFDDIASISSDEIQSVATASTSFDLWWCRAIANRKGIPIPFMDWCYYNEEMLRSQIEAEMNVYNK